MQRIGIKSAPSGNSGSSIGLIIAGFVLAGLAIYAISEYRKEQEQKRLSESDKQNNQGLDQK